MQRLFWGHCCTICGPTHPPPTVIKSAISSSREHCRAHTDLTCQTETTSRATLQTGPGPQSTALPDKKHIYIAAATRTPHRRYAPAQLHLPLSPDRAERGWSRA
ncbi:hypothetical protein DNTS_005385 [Danionella cerebrum]|uniref:Uncharacterized protein n=1 Tax=Danionella cerebrum TaxID=2873325 RepID=A0A553NM39_9TELE|nr:hypothetical protein DNTS_005385 [Danionella translucida]